MESKTEDRGITGDVLIAGFAALYMMWADESPWLPAIAMTLRWFKEKNCDTHHTLYTREMRKCSQPFLHQTSLFFSESVFWFQRLSLSPERSIYSVPDIIYHRGWLISAMSMHLPLLKQRLDVGFRNWLTLIRPMKCPRFLVHAGKLAHGRKGR